MTVAPLVCLIAPDSVALRLLRCSHVGQLLLVVFVGFSWARGIKSEEVTICYYY